MLKPYAESCDQNRDPILQVIRQEFANSRSILEIGSGTGQHAIYFAQNLPNLIWHTSECRENMAGINLWVDDYPLPNIVRPIELDVNNNWPDLKFEGVFSANTAHIMSWDEVMRLFEGIGNILMSGFPFCLYGPFNYNGKYSSESNARFDIWLKQRDPSSGIRNFEHLNSLAEQNDMTLLKDYEMPVNNRLLVWIKK